MKDGLKCGNAIVKREKDRNILKCKIDGQLCGYQFFCPNLNQYINSDRCVECNKYIEMEEI